MEVSTQTGRQHAHAALATEVQIAKQTLTTVPGRTAAMERAWMESTPTAAVAMLDGTDLTAKMHSHVKLVPMGRSVRTGDRLQVSLDNVLVHVSTITVGLIVTCFPAPAHAHAQPQRPPQPEPQLRQLCSRPPQPLE